MKEKSDYKEIYEHIYVRLEKINIYLSIRDFEGGTLGLAWTGDLKNAGGVCEKNGVRTTSSSLSFTTNSHQNSES